MDNLCHSLVGAALSGAGLRRRTGLATVTMVLGANLPDVDAFVYLGGDGTTALAFRRGWTHGVLAMVVLPVLLAALMLLIGRGLAAHRSRRARAVAPQPVRPGQLLLLAAISIWSHPLLDGLNSYGVRLLMPFSSRWFYGDTLFIADPWMWLVLGIGAGVSLRRARAVPVGAATARVMRHVERPAKIAVIAMATYIAVMLASSALGRSVVERQVVASGGVPATDIMVAPDPVLPFTRSVVRDLGGTYETGHLTWSIPPRYVASPALIPSALETPPARAAALTPRGQRFLSWSRFPFAESDSSAGAILVRLDDVRYAGPGQASWAGVTITFRSIVADAR